MSDTVAKTERYSVPQRSVEQMIAAARQRRWSQRDVLLVALAADTGLRAKEFAQLRESDILYGDDGLPSELLVRSEIQKQYPHADGRPPTVKISLGWLDEHGDRNGFSLRLLLDSYLKSEYYGQYGDEGWLFPSQKGGHMSYRTVHTLVSELAVEADVDCLSTTRGQASASDVSPHVLRHSLAAMMIERSASMVQVQARLRHSSLSTTERIYTHFVAR